MMTQNNIRSKGCLISSSFYVQEKTLSALDRLAGMLGSFVGSLADSESFRLNDGGIEGGLKEDQDRSRMRIWWG